MTATTDLPAPLVPPDTTITGLTSFMLNVDRLFASELWAISTGEEFKAAVALWGRAWQQIPAGSLPDDERLLAAFSGAGRRWSKVRDVAMRGFVKCSDGRFYHRVLSEDVIRAAKAKREKLERTVRATEARKKKDGDDTNPPSGGKKLNGFSETGDRHVVRHDQRHDARDDQRNDLRHEERNDPHVLNVTTNVTSTHRRDETIREEREEEEKARPAVAHTPGARPAASPEAGMANEAGPSLAEGWNSRENIARIEARVRRDMVGNGPLDPKASPIAKLVAEGFDLENEVVPTILDIELGSSKPIRSWEIYAARARERINFQRKLAKQPDAPAPDAIDPNVAKVTLGHLGEFAEPVLATYVAEWRKDPTCWFPFLGPKPGEPGCLIPNRMLIGEAA